MPTSRRNLILIIGIVLATLCLVASMKHYYSTGGRQSANPFTILKEVTRGIDPSFYDSGARTAVSSTTPSPSVAPRSQTSVTADPATARAYIVGDVETGQVYISKNTATRLSVASISKLITAFVALDTIPPDTIITIAPEQTLLAPDKSNLLAGEQFTLQTLLEPLLLSSSNVAAEAIASSIDRPKFLELMSSYAWEVGMPSTFFADPSGLSPQNVATAKDMFALAKYVYTYRPDVLAITRIVHAETATTTEHGFHNFDSTHPFVTDPGFIGGKTGRTEEAGETMITIMEIKGQAIVVVVLGSNWGARESDTRYLIQKVTKMIQ